MSKAKSKAPPGGSRKSTPASAVHMHQPAKPSYFMLDWLFSYQKSYIASDIMAGIIVAIMLLPQSIAYAMLAGLPPQTGLYAAIVPLLLYPLFGTSTSLAVGPVAIVSLMVASTLTPLAAVGSADYIVLALLLALMSGVILLIAGLLGIGQFTNFISHPVIAGFTTAAALIIGFSQIKHLLGIDLPRTSFIPTLLMEIFQKIGLINVASLMMGIAAILLLLSKNFLKTLLERIGLATSLADLVSKSLPLVVVVVATALTWSSQLDMQYGIKTVGDIPSGLPRLTSPLFDLATIKQLLGPALIIAIIGYVESLAVAKSLAAKRREVIDPNRELLGLGVANIGAAFTGGYPVTGGFSRSVVNFSAGAKTQGTAIITAILIALFLIFLTPALYFLPKVILAAIILVAISNLIDFKSFFSAWHYNRADGLAFGVTFLAVLALGVEMGILLGIATSIGMYLWQTSQPHFAILGRIEGTEHFRNINRHFVDFDDDTLIIRIDENLYFANTAWLENRLLTEVALRKSVRHVILNLNSVSYIDSSALEALESSIVNLRASGVTLHFAEIKGPVLDRLAQTDLIDHLMPGGIFLTTHDATLFLQSSKNRIDHGEQDTKADKSAWLDVATSHNTFAIETFLKENPASRYAGHARRKLLHLEDDKAFLCAKEKNSIEAYQGYLQRSSHSGNPKNIAKARTSMRYLRSSIQIDPFVRSLIVLYVLAGLCAALFYWLKIP